MDDDDEALAALRALGLNQVEAEVYLFLLDYEPVTAYAVGKAIGKATANVYKAVESLARQGAVLLEEGEARRCRAVPQEEFLARTRRAFERKTRDAERVLAAFGREHHDERVYRIEDPDGVFELSERMLASAEEIAIVDAFPTALAGIAAACCRAADRGVTVRVEAYREVDLPGCDVVVVSTGQESVERWGAEQLNVVVDGRQMLLALLTPELDRVHQAIWSESLYLACVVHSGRLSEHTLHRVRRALEEEAEDGAASAALDRHEFFVDRDVPGQRSLYRRYAASAEEEQA